MRTAHVKIRLANALRPDLSPVEVEAVTDLHQPCLQLPARLAARLGLKAVCTRLASEKSGKRIAQPYVGPLQLQLGSQLCYTGAVVNGSKVRIGFTVLSAMSPVTKTPTAFYHE